MKTEEFNSPRPFNAYEIYIAGLGEGSRRSVEQRLGKVAALVSGETISAEDFHWERLRRAHMEFVRSQLIDSGLQPSSINPHLSAVRKVLNICKKIGSMSYKDCAWACDVEGVEDRPTLRGRILTLAELQAIASVCKCELGPSGPRDSALLATMAGAGLRREEVTQLQLADYDRENTILVVRRGKQREIPLPTDVARELDAWIDVRGPDPGPLFLRTKKGKAGKVISKGVCCNSIYNICRRRARQAKVAKFTPNDLRTTFCSSLLGHGGNLLHVQKLMGHASPVTTIKYDKHPATAKRETVALLNGFWTEPCLNP
jgi:integrase